MVWMIAKEENTNYLCHHGIKGQKWGVRRYQNEDGSYTEEGKKRRSNSANKNTLLTSKDFKMKDSILEYIGPNDEYTAIADPERLDLLTIL